MADISTLFKVVFATPRAWAGDSPGSALADANFHDTDHLMPELDFSDPASQTRFLLIADKIRHDPSLLAIPLENIARWIANGIDGQDRLERLRELILAAQASPVGLNHLLQILGDEREEACHFKSFAPFAGILTRAERQRLILQTCGFRH